MAALAACLVVGCDRGEHSLTFEVTAKNYELVVAQYRSLQDVQDELQDVQDGYLVKIAGFHSTTSPGDPILPIRILEYALPPDVDWGSVKMTVVPGPYEEEELPGRFDVLPAPPLRTWVPDPDSGLREFDDWGFDKDIASGRNKRAYDPNEFFPAEIARIAGHSRMRKWRFLQVAFQPVQYNPVQRRLRITKSATITITYVQARRNDDEMRAELADGFMDDVAEKRFANFKAARDWYPVVPRPGPPRYTILTTNAIRRASARLDAFVEHKRCLGFEVAIVTEDQYVELHNAHKIREWLQKNYVRDRIEYLLLIGNPDPDNEEDSHDAIGDVPMLTTWPRRTEREHRAAATDYYYADLTGNWDLNCNGFHGETRNAVVIASPCGPATATNAGVWTSGDHGIGGVDLAPELYVGRIPVYQDTAGGISRLDGILDKIVAFDSGSEANGCPGRELASCREAPEADRWWTRVLVAAARLEGDTSGDYQMGQALMTSSKARGFHPYRVYEYDTGRWNPDCPYIIGNPVRPDCVCCIQADSRCSFLKEWGRGYGLVAWSTHGGPTEASKLVESSQAVCLDDCRPAFTFQGACNNGQPEDPNNLGFALLKHGAIGTVSASRTSWYQIFDPGPVHPSLTPDPNPLSGSNGNLAYHYSEELMSGAPAASSLYEIKSRLPPGDVLWWPNVMVYNLYGDPVSRLRGPAWTDSSPTTSSP